MRIDGAAIQNPVFHLGAADVRDPAVFLHEGIAHVFFTHFDFKARAWHIGATTTRDFVTFGPVRVVSPEGYASPGNVVRDGGEYVLCYQQYREFPHTVCLSRSADLLNWSEPESVFNTGPDNLWNTDGRVIDPYIVKAAGQWYCYYTGSTRWGRDRGHNLIGVARSMDLRSWEDISLKKPVIGVDEPWEEPDGNENNCVIRHDGRWLMLYSASLKYQQIAWAVSDDLIHWQKGGRCELPEFDASAGRFGAPFIIEGLVSDRPGTHYLIYQGENAAGRMSFLLLESSDLIHWYDPR